MPEHDSHERYHDDRAQRLMTATYGDFRVMLGEITGDRGLLRTVLLLAYGIDKHMSKRVKDIGDTIVMEWRGSCCARADVDALSMLISESERTNDVETKQRAEKWRRAITEGYDANKDKERATAARLALDAARSVTGDVERRRAGVHTAFTIAVCCGIADSIKNAVSEAVLEKSDALNGALWETTSMLRSPHGFIELLKAGLLDEGTASLGARAAGWAADRGDEALATLIVREYTGTLSSFEDVDVIFCAAERNYTTLLSAIRPLIDESLYEVVADAAVCAVEKGIEEATMALVGWLPRHKHGIARAVACAAAANGRDRILGEVLSGLESPSLEEHMSAVGDAIDYAIKNGRTGCFRVAMAHVSNDVSTAMPKFIWDRINNAMEYEDDVDGITEMVDYLMEVAPCDERSTEESLALVRHTVEKSKNAAVIAAVVRRIAVIGAYTESLAIEMLL